MSDLNTEIFIGSADRIYFSPYRQLFGGLVYFIQNTALAKTPIPWVAGALIVLFLLRRRWAVPHSIFLGVAMATNVLLAMRLGSAWDEFYINLRHSWVLREVGSYSFNVMAPGEATVDFLSYFLAGVLGQGGLPLEETVLTLHLGGNLLFLYLLWRFIKDTPAPGWYKDLGLILSCLFPPALYLGISGFTGLLFASVLAAGVFLWTRNRLWPACVVLAVLPLVRVEGILFNFLFWLQLAAGTVIPQTGVSRRERVKAVITQGIVLAGPFILLSVWRELHFGSFMPMPVLFKNTNFDHRYLTSGFFRLLDCLHLFNVWIALLIVVGIAVYGVRKRTLGVPDRRLLGMLALSGLFILSYYSSGGDWFPDLWGRYALPFLLLLWVAFFTLVGSLFSILPRPAAACGVLGLVGFFLIWGSANAYRETVADIGVTGNRWPRVENLAAFGLHLSETSEPDEVIASPEVATTMYFAQRDLLDLLGVANPEIATSTLAPLYGTDLTQKRRNPRTIEWHLPAYIAYWGSENRSGFHWNGQPIAALALRIREVSFDPPKPTVLYYRIGSFERISRLGYRNVSVFSGEYSFNYFVSSGAYGKHVNRLRQLGFKSLGSADIPISLPDDMVARFPD